MSEEGGDYGSEFDAALARQMDNDTLQLSFLSLLSTKELIRVASVDFHEAILIRNNEGLVTAYLPDTLEAFENCVEMLDTILEGYKDDDFNKLKFETSDKREERRKNAFKHAKELFILMKRLGLMPGENSNMMEIIGKTQAQRKQAKKEESVDQ